MAPPYIILYELNFAFGFNPILSTKQGQEIRWTKHMQCSCGFRLVEFLAKILLVQ